MNYFKSAVGFFLFFLPQMLKRRTSALLPITNVLPKQNNIKKYENHCMRTRYFASITPPTSPAINTAILTPVRFGAFFL